MLGALPRQLRHGNGRLMVGDHHVDEVLLQRNLH
jgi:hypothetical protein